MAFNSDGMWLSAMAGMLNYAEDQDINLFDEKRKPLEFYYPLVGGIKVTIGRFVPQVDDLLAIPGVTAVRSSPTLSINIAGGLENNTYKWVVGSDIVQLISGPVVNDEAYRAMRLLTDTSILGYAINELNLEKELEFERQYLANHGD